MAAKALPCPTMLRLVLRYEPETGKLFWKERPVWMFKNDKYPAARNAKRWNTAWAGREALAADDGKGYRRGSLLGTRQRAHVVIMAIMTGEWPSGDIDHINRVRSDNRFCNLREVSHAENCRNMSLSSHNKTGATGVRRAATNGKFLASIKIPGQNPHLGTFDSFDEAVAARQRAAAAAGWP